MPVIHAICLPLYLKIASHNAMLCLRFAPRQTRIHRVLCFVDPSLLLTLQNGAMRFSICLSLNLQASIFFCMSHREKKEEYSSSLVGGVVDKEDLAPAPIKFQKWPFQLATNTTSLDYLPIALRNPSIFNQSNNGNGWLS